MGCIGVDDGDGRRASEVVAATTLIGLNRDVETLEEGKGVVEGECRTLTPFSMSMGRWVAGREEDAGDDTDGEAGCTCTNLRRSIGWRTFVWRGGVGGAVGDAAVKCNVFRMSIGRSEGCGAGAMWA
jgi:hypothetical protein